MLFKEIIIPSPPSGYRTFLQPVLLIRQTLEWCWAVVSNVVKYTDCVDDRSFTFHDLIRYVLLLVSSADRHLFIVFLLKRIKR